MVIVDRDGTLVHVAATVDVVSVSGGAKQTVSGRGEDTSQVSPCNKE